MAEDTDDEPLSSQTSVWDEDKEYNVQEIVSEKQVKGRSFYLVKWEDYSERHNTWEPEESFVAPLSLQVWAQRKELERNGLVEPFDVKKWERERAAREKRKQAQRKRKAATRPRTRSNTHIKHIDTRLPSSSEEEISDNSSEDSEPLAKSFRKHRRHKSDFSDKNAQDLDRTARVTNKNTTIRLSAQDVEQRSVKIATSRQAPMTTSVTAKKGNADTKGNKTLRVNKSSRLEEQGSKRDDVRKGVKVTKPDAILGNKSKNATAGSLPSHTITKDLDFASPTDQQRAQTASHPSILGENWNKSKKKVKVIEKTDHLDAVPYKTMRWQRRAEKRGRDEPEPNIKHLEFIDLNKSSSAVPHRPRVDQKQSTLKNVPEEANSSRDEILLSEPGTGELQPAEGRISNDDANNAMATNKRHLPPSSVTPINRLLINKTGDRVDTGAGTTAPMSSPSSLIAPRPPLLSLPRTNPSRQDRGATGPDTRSEGSMSIIMDDRGVAASETYRLADPVPFKSLACNIRPHADHNFAHNPVYGYIMLGSLTTLVELACATSGVRRLLLEQKDGNRNEVLFPCTRSITSEEYQEILHEPGSIYFGAGHIKHRADRSSNVSAQHAEHNLMSIASELRDLRSAAIFFGNLFSLVIWPTGDPSWSFLDSIFAADPYPTALRFLARSPIKVDTFPNRATSVQRLRPQFYETSSASKQLLKTVFGLDWDNINSDHDIQHLFLLYRRSHQREHDIIYACARHVGLTVWSSMEPGHWTQFCTQIAGPSGQTKPTHRQKGVVLLDVSFTQLGYLPRLFRIIHRGTRLFAVDTAQKGAKEHAMHKDHLTQSELIRQGRFLDNVKFLEGKANLQSCDVDLLYSIPPKMTAVELFPADRGTALLLLDSVMMRDPSGACKVLQWLKSQGAGKRHRLIVRPKLREWIFQIISEIRNSDKDKNLATAWERLYEIVTDLMGLDKITTEEIDLQEDDYPPVICLPLLSGSDDYHTYEACVKSKSLVRDQDQRLFELFAAWTVKEIRLFRRFQAVIGERDAKDFEDIHANWTRRWKYITMIRADEYVRGLDVPYQS